MLWNIPKLPHRIYAKFYQTLTAFSGEFGEKNNIHSIIMDYMIRCFSITVTRTQSVYCLSTLQILDVEHFLRISLSLWYRSPA